MKKKGFTLIELLAVIVILAVIALIATPVIMDAINGAKKGATKDSAYGYMKAIEYYVAQSYNDDDSSNDIPLDGAFNFYDHFQNIAVKGEPLDGISVELNDGQVYNGVIVFEPYLAEIVEGIVTNIVEIDTSAPEGDSCFVTDNNKITGYMGNCSKNVVIPEIINGVTITEISEFAFANNEILSITLPDSITTIKDGAFMDNLLVSITIPYSVTELSSYILTNNKLTSFVINDSVTAIKDSVLSNNQLSELVIPNSVVYIGNASFWNNQLESITIPSSVTEIGSGAFLSNKLTNITIPTSVVTIGAGVFNDNVLPDNQAFIYARNSDGTIDNTTLISYGGANKAEIVIPATVTNIGYFALANSQILDITIPPTVITIVNGALNNNLLPDDKAFIYARNGDGTIDNTVLISYGGAKKENVNIPSTVTNLGLFSMDNTAIKSVNIPNTVTTIEDHALSNNELTSITIPDSVLTIGNTVLAGNINMNRVTMASTGIILGYNVVSYENDLFRDAYESYGAGIYNLTTQGTWIKE